MFWMFRRLWPVLIAAVWLAVVVFQFRSGVVTWVLAPLIAAAGFLIFCAYLDERAPALAKWLKVKTTVLMLGYTVFVLVLPQFPRLQQALTDRQRFEDVRFANSVEGCLSGMQAVIGDYRAKLEDAQSTQIARELDQLALTARTRPLGEEDRKREEAIRSRIREIATSRSEWVQLLAACDPPAAVPSQSEAAKAVGSPDSLARGEAALPAQKARVDGQAPENPRGENSAPATKGRALEELAGEYDALVSQVSAIQASLQQRTVGIGPLKPEISAALDTARRDLASAQLAIEKGDRETAAARLQRVRVALPYLQSL